MTEHGSVSQKKKQTTPTRYVIQYIAASTAFVAALLGVLLYFDTQTYVWQLFEWLETIGLWAAPLFILIDMLVVVFLLPGIIFTLGAGFLFGVLKGSLYVIIGTTLGAALAFAAARHLFGEKTAKYILSNPKLHLVHQELNCKAWKIILLTRFLPFFPFKLSNYFFGLTQFSLRDFLLGTFFGIMPITITNVYIGSLAANLATLGSRPTPNWGIYGLGFFVTVAVTLYFAHVAGKILRT